MKRFPGNCLIVALICGGLRTRAVRNRAGRWHFYWRDPAGLAREFHAPGSSQRGYLGNALYLGRVRRCPSMDAARG